MFSRGGSLLSPASADGRPRDDVIAFTGKFGGQIQVENLCKNMVAMEATCPTPGHILDGPAEVMPVVSAMLETMFQNRSGNLDNIPVDIREGVRLAGHSVGERIEQLASAAGPAAAEALLAELGIRE